MQCWIQQLEFINRVLQASVMNGFEKLMEWALKNDDVLAGNTSSLAAAALILASQAYQVSKTLVYNPRHHGDDGHTIFMFCDARWHHDHLKKPKLAPSECDVSCRSS